MVTSYDNTFVFANLINLTKHSKTRYLENSDICRAFLDSCIFYYDFMTTNVNQVQIMQNRNWSVTTLMCHVSLNMLCKKQSQDFF